MIERILDRLDAQDARSQEFREETLKALGEIKTDIAVLKANNAGARGGIKLVGWVLVFGLNIVSVAVTYFIAK
jgi:hypothetical protein